MFMNNRRDFLKAVPFAGLCATTLAACSTTQQPEEDQRSSNNFELFYVDKGRGKPIVFVPGFTFSSEVFEHQIDALSKTNRVIVLDPRSHGQSPIRSDGNNYQQHGIDLHDVFESLDLTDMVLVGWSFGALSAWSYVKQFGLDRVSHFVCIDMPPVPLSAKESEGDWVELPIAHLPGAYEALSTKEGQAAFLGGYAQNIMVQRELSDEELQWLVSLSLRTPPAIAQQLFASGCFSNYLDTAVAISNERPSLFILAEHWSEIAAPYLANSIPNASKETLGGHMMFWEHPEAFNQILMDFID